MLDVAANHQNAPVAADDFAVVAHLFDTAANFHIASSRRQTCSAALDPLPIGLRGNLWVLQAAWFSGDKRYAPAWYRRG